MNHWKTRKKKAERTVLAAVGVFICAFAVFSALPAAAVTQTELGLTPGLAQNIGLSTRDIRETIALIINAFLGLLGLVMVVLMIYAGFLYMTSQGNEEQVTKAKAIIRNAIIGLIIITLSYAIVRFVFGVIENAVQSGPGAGGQPPVIGIDSARRGRSALGNGIIEYHYPEPGQTDVPRNTKIAVTFKKPLALSTIFKNYDDKGTIATADDKICNPDCATANHAEDAITPTTVFQLNTANIKIIAQENLGQAPSSGTDDAKFNGRYPDGTGSVAGAIVDPAPRAKATPLTAAVFDANERQTLTIAFSEPLGSASADVNYRVALRGGANGIKVWVPKAASAPAADPPQKQIPAFDTLFSDGSYYWPFTTGTTLDTTPPKITAVVPLAVSSDDFDAADKLLFRNQLLAIYFDEPVDPTTASGLTGAGAGRGFNKIEVKAKCLAAPCGGWTMGATTTTLTTTAYETVPGVVRLSNRYSTAEFIPDTPCDNVSTNSCGEKVYCLPKNAELQVTILAASISTATPPSPEPPEASTDDGVLDMVGNSFDGNKDGHAQGPSADGEFYSMNPPAPAALTGIKDSARWFSHTGDRVDLVPPTITLIDPQSFGTTAPAIEAGTPYTGGPSLVPPATPITITWSKTMSPSSFQTGTLTQIVPAVTTPPTLPTAAVTLKTGECFKHDTSTACPNPDATKPPCPCDIPTFPSPFGPIVQRPPTLTENFTVTTISHESFLTINDLGYTETDQLQGANTPSYAPVLGARIRDDRQNCFYPSRGYSCDLAPDKKSCCNRVGLDDFPVNGCP